MMFIFDAALAFLSSCPLQYDGKLEFGNQAIMGHRSTAKNASKMYQSGMVGQMGRGWPKICIG